MSKHRHGFYWIGLTGNIATGKSAVMQRLAEHGAATLDADQIVHDLLRRGTAEYDQVVAEFGSGILRPDKEIDRRRLGAIVFSDPRALQRLEAITHPAVGIELQRRIAEVQNSRAAGAPSLVVVVEAIKLIESGLAADCDALWVVTAPYQAQVQRLMTTRGLTEEQARLRIQAQPPQAEKVARADVVIDNSGSLESLQAQVDAAWNEVMRRIHVSG